MKGRGAGGEGEERSEGAELACSVSAAATICMFSAFAAHLIIHPKATDPLN